jgi:hypothetical protein
MMVGVDTILLPEGEERAYRLLVRVGEARAGDLAELASIRPGEAGELSRRR